MTFIVYGPGLQYQVTPESLLRTPGTPIIPPTEASHKIADKDHPEQSNYYHQQKKAQQAYQETTQQRVEHRVTTAEEIMSSPLLVMHDFQHVQEARELLQAKKIRHLPIVGDEGLLVGIISERDILYFSLTDEDEEQTRLASLITKEVLSATHDTDIRDLAKVMSSHHIGALPILSPDKYPIGIVTRSDILKALIHHTALELWA